MLKYIYTEWLIKYPGSANLKNIFKACVKGKLPDGCFNHTNFKSEFVRLVDALFDYAGEYDLDFQFLLGVTSDEDLGKLLRDYSECQNLLTAPLVGVQEVCCDELMSIDSDVYEAHDEYIEQGERLVALKLLDQVVEGGV